VNYSESYLE